ncbi:MAG TPA: sugar ABC transporter ATP-binding protein [Lentisphaeria bacterium]|nr:MAG: sugar ABC transporter ATP-binding protein [Lentisphaerae bacterium GWF2_38_69]HBM17125.1 sugar ABC transporter ATP-binding protein [Lentisphaeria bacterium]
MAEILIEKLEKTYPSGFKAVHGIDLKIKDGEFMVFVGPSGCAKSTVLRMIAGLEEITGGTISIGGRVVNNLDPKDRKIAMVFQNYALYPHMTVYENMAFGLKLAKLPKKEIAQRVKAAAAKLEIEHLLDRKPKDMSGGQRQRVAVGRAIVRKPDVFLFDEPLSNLDAKLRISMRARLVQLHRELKKEGQTATMVYVTHDQVEAMTMGDRITVLKDGVILQIDTPLNLYNSPLNKFVAGFIGSPSMNFQDALLEQSEDNFTVTISGHKFALPHAKSEKIRKHLDIAGKGSLTSANVALGIRPDHIEEKPNNTNKEGFEGEITLIEKMGNESYCYFKVAGNEYVARINGEASAHLQIGDKQKFYIRMDKCHIFDAETERNISL